MKVSIKSKISSMRSASRKFWFLLSLCRTETADSPILISWPTRRRFVLFEEIKFRTAPMIDSFLLSHSDWYGVTEDFWRLKCLQKVELFCRGSQFFFLHFAQLWSNVAVVFNFRLHMGNKFLQFFCVGSIFWAPHNKNIKTWKHTLLRYTYQNQIWFKTEKINKI